jgi:uncharacterized protein
MNEDVTVIYHANCYDGVTAAWVAHKKFGPGAQYVAMNYSDEPPNIKDRRVFMVDFCLKRKQMIQMFEDSEKLVVLDHHATAVKELEGLSEEYDLDEIVFDMNRSGAGIAWDYFFPDKSRPDLVNYVEDRDLWRFVLQYSREVNAYIQSYDIDLATWVDVFRTGCFSLDVDHLVISSGKALLRQQSKLVKSICEHARLKSFPIPYHLTSKTVDVWGQYNLGSNSGVYVETSILMSEVCEQLLNTYLHAPFAWYSFKRKDGKTQYGLRSRADSDVDVSEIAKLYGGGGHKHAAGFEL